MAYRVFTVRNSEDFGRTIGELRRERGLTQQQAAEQWGLSRSHLGHIERGRAPRMVGVVLRIIRRLGGEVRVVVGDGAA